MLVCSWVSVGGLWGAIEEYVEDRCPWMVFREKGGVKRGKREEGIV